MPLKPSTLQIVDDMLLRYPALSHLHAQITGAAEIICNSHRAGGKLLACGNGGSAADAEHIIGELVKSFVLRRAIKPSDYRLLEQSGFEDWREIAENLQQGITAIALTGHPALATAIANDVSAEMIFAQQVYVYGRRSDVMLALSTSGNSKNVVRALQVARAFGLATIGMTGGKPCKMDALCDVIIKVPSEETFKIQEFHLPVYHSLCLMIECELFEESQGVSPGSVD